MYAAGRQHSHRSPGRAPSLASEARAECSSAAALSSTPFGTPVDPEVLTITAVLSATPPFSAGTNGGDTSGILDRVRGERGQQVVQPGRGQRGVQRGDGRPGTVERRGQQLEQPRAGALDQDRMQGAVSHDR